MAIVPMAAFGFSARASASTPHAFVVDTLDDGVAVPTDCSTPFESSCSLRDALAAVAEGDSIVFDPDLIGSIVATQGTFVVSRSIDLHGPGSESISIMGDGLHRVFLVSESAGDVTISGLRISGGTNELTDEMGGAGIAALNSGALRVIECGSREMRP